MDVECYDLARHYLHHNKKFETDDKMFQLQEMIKKGELLKMKRDLDKLSVFMPGSKNLVQ